MVKYYNINTIVIFPLFMIHDPPLAFYWDNLELKEHFQRQTGRNHGWMVELPQIQCHTIPGGA